MSRKTRAYSLVFGQPIKVADDYFVPPFQRGTSPYISLDKYYNESDPNAYLIDKHNVKFTLTKSEKVNNKLDITIDNLSEGTKAYLTSHKNDNLAIVLKVGYEENVKLAFQGTMTECTITKTSNTNKTRIVATDGGLNTSKAYTSRVFPAGTKLKRVVDELILDLGCPRGYVADLPQSYVIDTQFTIFGETNRNLKRLLDAYDYVGTINNGAFDMLPINSRKTETAAFISPDTGLLGNVQSLDTKAKPAEKTEKDTSSKKRIRFTCQMDGTLNPQSSVFVKDPAVDVNGAFKIEKSSCVCTGFETGTWVTTVDAVELDATIATNNFGIDSIDPLSLDTSTAIA